MNGPAKLPMVCDIVNPLDMQGRTYRQINHAKTHMIPLGSLVELDGGARAYVVHLGRDCDETPLYYVSIDPDDTEQNRVGFRNNSWYGGCPEDGLTVIPPPATSQEPSAPPAR